MFYRAICRGHLLDENNTLGGLGKADDNPRPFVKHIKIQTSRTQQLDTIFQIYASDMYILIFFLSFDTLLLYST